MLTTWQRGRELITRSRTEEEGPLRPFVDGLRDLDPPIYRSPGTAVFLNAGKETTPLAMRANVEHNRTLHENVVILSIETLTVPHVPVPEQVVIDDLGYRDDGISHVAARLGFQDSVDAPKLLRLADPAGAGGRLRRRHGVLLPLPDDDRRHRGARHAALAQAALHGARAQLVEPGRVLRAPRRPHGRHGVDRDLLTAQAA